MLTVFSWKSRPLSPEQSARMMTAWAATEQLMAESPNTERIGWYMAVDGSGGVTISRSADADAAGAMSLTLSLMLGEFIEMESKQVLDLEGAMPSITAAMASLGT